MAQNIIISGASFLFAMSHLHPSSGAGHCRRQNPVDRSFYGFLLPLGDTHLRLGHGADCRANDSGGRLGHSDLLRVSDVRYCRERGEHAGNDLE